MGTLNLIVIFAFVCAVHAHIYFTVRPNPYITQRNSYCFKKEGITQEQIAQVHKDFSRNITEEKNRNTKCFQACLYETTKQLSSDGAVDLVALKYQAPIMFGLIADKKLDQIIEEATKCAQESSESRTDRCDRAWSYFICTRKKWRKQKTVTQIPTIIVKTNNENVEQ